MHDASPDRNCLFAGGICDGFCLRSDLFLGAQCPMVEDVPCTSTCQEGMYLIPCAIAHGLGDHTRHVHLTDQVADSRCDGALRVHDDRLVDLLLKVKRDVDFLHICARRLDLCNCVPEHVTDIGFKVCSVHCANVAIEAFGDQQPDCLKENRKVIPFGVAIGRCLCQPRQSVARTRVVYDIPCDCLTVVSDNRCHCSDETQMETDGARWWENG